MKKTLGDKWHEESQALGALEGTLIGLVLSLGFIFFVLTGACTSGVFADKTPVEEVMKPYVSDIMMPEHVEVVSPIAAMLLDNTEQEAVEEEPVEEEYYEEEYYEEEYYDYGYSGGGSSDGFMQAGVRDGVDSDTETWYSSNQAYHYRTSEWSPDEEGYYRNSDGYYVVASSDYPEGTIIETSKGEAIVLDSGTDSGNVDFYVNW